MSYFCDSEHLRPEALGVSKSWWSSYSPCFSKSLKHGAKFHENRTCTLSEKYIGVGAQSTLGGHHIFARKICIKNQQNARILHDFCPKNARILCNNYPKKIFSRILGGGGTCPPATPSPTPMEKYNHKERNQRTNQPTNKQTRVMTIPPG